MGVQTATAMTESSHAPVKPTPQNVTKAERLVTFRRALASGCTMVEAAKAADISIRTADRWKRAIQGEVVNIREAVDAIAKKDELAALGTTIARDETIPPQYRLDGAELTCKVMGLFAPKETHNVNVQVTVAPDMLSLIRARRAARIAERERQQLASGEQRAIEGGGGSPMRAAAESVTAPQNISSNPEKEGA